MSPRGAATHSGVHPTAQVGDDVELEPGVTVGPYCVISGRVKIGARSRVLPHTVIEGTTFVGADCHLGPHAAIGTPPQHRGYDGRETYLVIRDDVIAREFSSIHRATGPGLERATRVGQGSLIMAGAHMAHDCQLGDHVTLANAVQLGGHVSVGNRAFVGGGVVAHQFCRIGTLAIVSGGEIVSKDVLPYGSFKHAGHRAYNAVGCRRAGLAAGSIRALRAAFHTLHQRASIAQGAAILREMADASRAPEVGALIDFVVRSRRGVHASVSRRFATASADAED